MNPQFIKRLVFFAFALLAQSNASVFAQAEDSEPERPPMKVVVSATVPASERSSNIAPRFVPTPNQSLESSKPGGPSLATSPGPAGIASPTMRGAATSGSGLRSLSFSQIKSKIADAKRQMLNRPMATAATDSTVPMDFVRIAFLDSKTQQVDFAVLAKEAFLALDEKPTISEKGRKISIRTIRGNGVNTPLAINDELGAAHMPLIVQYPVVKNGRYTETAYYVSTHNGLDTPEVVNAGRFYVRNVIEIARERLKEKGITVQPRIADIAERLATVEHVDHQRFRNEYHPNIYNDIFTLYALNEGQTYRYSVSSAGAGGMVQMIPATYRMVRSMYPGVGLMPDFVEGMRNHVNASQAMLLYMQMTWNDLVSRPTIGDAMANSIATQQQLMAAGYNSNPAKLAGYINRGGAQWTSLIPRETRIYLQIYDSLERFVPMAPRTR